MSPTLASPPTVPVTEIVDCDSAWLIVLSDVIGSIVIAAAA